MDVLSEGDASETRALLSSTDESGGESFEYFSSPGGCKSSKSNTEQVGEDVSEAKKVETNNDKPVDGLKALLQCLLVRLWLTMSMLNKWVTSFNCTLN